MLGLLLWPVGSPAETPEEIAGDCLDCHGHDAGRPGEPEAEAAAVGRVDGRGFARSPHGVLTCVACHLWAEIQPHPDVQMEVLECRGCHETGEFEESVHGRLLPGETACLRCHDPHGLAPIHALSARDRVEMCTGCHADEVLMKAHGIGPEWVRGYRRSFHGRAIRMGDERVADCISCHTAHGVRSSQDPRSTTHESNLLRTCSAIDCHPAATAAFVKGSSHGVYAGWKKTLIRAVRWFYIVVILVLVGPMLLHNLLDLRARLRERSSESGRPEGEETMVRWTGGERVQHGLLVLSFVILAVTGFTLKIPEVRLEACWGLGNLVLYRGALHRWAAVVLIATSVYHVAYLRFSRRGREQWHEMRLRRSDLGELAATASYLVGRGDARVPKGRFGYVEKIDYFSLVSGVVVMSVTGLLLWVEEAWPLYAVDLARVIHSWEAILAVLAIVAWHIYFVHWRPGVFPMNRSWIDGRVPLADLEGEHPLEYERWRAARDGGSKTSARSST